MISNYTLKFLHTTVIIVSSHLVVFSQDARDLVSGNLIQFNDNGAWCWYQDERAVVDVAQGKLIIGSDASGSGVGGSSRNGNIEAVIFDLQTGLTHRFTLMKAGCDDHNAPAFLVRPDGKYLAMYAQHYDTVSRYRIYDGGQWSAEKQFDWNSIPGGTDFSTTYSNLFYLSAERKIYNFVRCYARSPNMMVSTNQGDTWTYGGLLTQPDQSIGYVNGYFKYSSNGVDRIDFVGTEHHPRDYNTSIYHGYIKNGQSFKSDGTLMDSVITDKTAPKPAAFTRVFAANTVVNNITMTRCWTIDLQTYADGTVATIFKARANDSETDHRFFYARYDGSKWTSTYLGKAGSKMYSSEQDYVGLGALHPNDPNTIYISTPFDPRDDSNLTVREIFKGVTTDHGATWSWTPITRKSVRDNFRPIVPAWDNNNTALLWWRGTYTSAQNFNAAVVGILDRRLETAGKMTYVDATLANTTLSTGAQLVTTGPDANMGASDNQWHQRTGFGNDGSVLTSAEIGGENAPTLKTRIIMPKAGTYELWVNFWANPTADWRIKAGLSTNGMQLFRQMACKQVEAGDHDSTLVLTGSGNTFLYQAYLGRVQVSANRTIEVFVDDEAIQTGTVSTLVGNTARTWYDGISYASVNNAVRVFENKNIPISFSLSQNYPNPFGRSPFNPTTKISYSLPKADFVTLKVYDILGRETQTLVDAYQQAGRYSLDFNASGLASGIYYCRLKVGNDFAETKKILLLR
ncbi:MAG: BNR-4 repeat-containing protein [candidate division KSB1 bacterium]|nr:BNR-4 repeat-containing protein [candidate division KSB1 bacterium]MDZ7302570.1 BNR-4 repeat-containing protein [candidate division KSB1 bacterium]MDZ7310664.1 BNR-4 repeat-containing protein [candidate division KSB1 bacterium]